MLHWNQLFSRPDSVLVSRFSQPLPRLHYVLHFQAITQLRRRLRFAEIIQIWALLSLSAGCCHYFSLTVSYWAATLIWVPIRVYVKPPDRLQKLLSFLFHLPYVISYPLFYVGRVFHLFSITENVWTSFTQALAVFVLCLTQSFFQKRRQEKPDVFAWRMTLSHVQSAFIKEQFKVQMFYAVLLMCQVHLNCKYFWVHFFWKQTMEMLLKNYGGMFTQGLFLLRLQNTVLQWGHGFDCLYSWYKIA